MLKLIGIFSVSAVSLNIYNIRKYGNIQSLIPDKELNVFIYMYI